GGEIRLKSTPGQGSIFTLFLPLEDPSEERRPLRGVNGRHFPEAKSPEYVPALAEEPDQSTVRLDLARHKNLLVDDDARSLFAVTSLLENHGAEVLTADSAQEGIDALRRERDVHLVLMDIMMPGMDGYEATRIIRRTPGLEGTPVIALTAKAMQEDR